ncbi:hypothetical protein [Dictyobacter arantiisoli]|uniref:hypothetical protein n=1 Tax=Dictyobacter arantiisoli TaxID=2014874 RepID=UPI001F2EBC66|nr:hypothetical protein [Dictyobacter arantiisoli]
MMGRSRPVTGAETRICKSTARPGVGSTTGLTETTGVGALMVTDVAAMSDSFIERSSFHYFAYDNTNRNFAPISIIRNVVPYVKRLFEGGTIATIAETAEPLIA